MQVNVENIGSLERRMKVTVPADRVDNEIEKRVKKLTQSARVDGFRPGKVPARIIKNRYGDAIRNEVVVELIQSCFSDAIKEQEINPAGLPQFDPKTPEKGQPFEFTATFEVYPEIELKSLDGETIEKPVAVITEADVDKMIEKLQRQSSEWVSVDRAAATGDQIVMDFEGSIDGETFEGGTATDFSLELGSKTLLPEFEEGLIGTKADAELTIPLTFPKDYGAADLAGKQAQFAVKVKSVSEAKLPELNDEFAKNYGIEEGGMDALRNDIEGNMQRELTNNLQQKQKDSVLNRLVEINKIDIPKTLLDAEIDRLQQQMKQQFAMQGINSGLPDFPRATFEEQAQKRVMLGLLLAEVVKKFELKADAELIRSKIDDIAKAYERPEEVVAWYYHNKEQLSEVESLVLEEQAVEKLMEQAAIIEKTFDYDEIMNPKKEEGAE